MTASNGVARTDVVVLCTDARFLLPCAFLLDQIATDPAGDRYDVVVVHDGVPDAQIRQLRERSKRGFDAIPFDADIDALASVPVTHALPLATYMRLCLHQLLPTRYQRILYLDCDIYVERPEIASVFDLDLAGAPFAVCQDASFAALYLPDDIPGRTEVPAQRAEVLAYKGALGLAPEVPYFNAGVMLIDRPAWEASGIPERAIAYATAHPERCRFADQSALNAVAQGQWAELSPRLNFQWFHAIARLEFDTVFRHFSGSDKAWNTEKWGARYTEHYRRWHAAAGWEGDFPGSGSSTSDPPVKHGRGWSSFWWWLARRSPLPKTPAEPKAIRDLRRTICREAFVTAMAGRRFVDFEPGAQRSLLEALTNGQRGGA